MTFIYDEHEQHTHRIRDLAIATVAALAVFGGMVSIAHSIRTASASAVEAPVVAAKTDRIASALPGACNGESWGNWSPACVAAISGNGSTRQVRFETFEARQPAANTSVLERVPANS
ncbi:hypothetical protein [Stappia sp.]|uniref:hypothetical protein n=1 Tax=Stappia sp. TaxID=1870903 RepID=UPI003D127632